jgi:hypothetical protein
MSVPPEMSPFDDAAQCAQEALTLDCSAVGFTIRPADDPGMTPVDYDVSVNGLSQARFAEGVLVRELGLDVTFSGITPGHGMAIADTIGVSSRWRATNEPAPPVPEGWRAIGFDNVQVMIPDEWPSVTVDPESVDPDACGFRGLEPAATFDRGGAVVSCVDVPPVVVPPSDGVRVYEQRPGESVTNMPGYPFLEQAFEIPGEGKTYVLRVGFGVNGTIGRAILGSLTIAPLDNPSATTPPPPSGDLGLPVPTTPEGWQVVEWGDVRLSLPPELNPSGSDEGGAPSCVVQDVQGIFALTCGERVVTIIPAVGAAGPDGAEALDLNGVVARRTENRCPSECVPEFRDSTEFVLVDLHVLVRFTGFDDADIDTIAGTLGVSSRWRSQHEQPPAVPADWATFEGDGFTFRHPADWPEIELGATDRDPDFCRVAPTAVPAVTIGVGNIGALVDCSLTLAPPSDGVRVFRRDGAAVIADGATEAIVLTAADGTEWVVRVGFGIDGSTGRAILASITSTLPPPPPTSAPPPDDTVYEAATMVIQEGDDLPQLCVFGVDESYPPQCQGVDLVGFDWSSVAPEGSDGGTTWGPAYVRGTYDRTADTLTVVEARPPTEADGVRLAAAMDTRRDRSIPCPTPPGGWPPPPAEWPGARLYDVGVFEWYLDDSGSVLIVKTNGDVAEREAAVRTVYDGPLCVVAVPLGDRSDLEAIIGELAAMSSVQFNHIDVVVDPNDAWVVAQIVAPDPDLQARLDAEYDEGTVRLTSILVPAVTP